MRILALITLVALMCSPVYAQAQANSPTGLIPIGPNDSETVKNISGVYLLVANPPAERKDITQVEIFLGKKSLGKFSKWPFKTELDTSKEKPDTYTIKALGYNDENVVVWASKSEVKIERPAKTETSNAETAINDNSKKPNKNDKKPDAQKAPPKPPSATSGPRPPAPSKTNNNEEPVRPLPDVSNGPKPPVQSDGYALTQTHANKSHGFTIGYPTGWQASDITDEMSPKEGGFWLVFSKGPADKADISINLHRKRLQPGTSASTFAEYNPYVKKWSRTSLNGAASFIDTSGSADNGRTIHRLIMIKDGSAWMMRCIDNSKQDKKLSLELLKSMATSLRTN